MRVPEIGGEEAVCSGSFTAVMGQMYSVGGALRKRARAKNTKYFSTVASKLLKSSLEAVFAKMLHKTFFHSGFTFFDRATGIVAELPAKT
jgi:hypothetical protein